MPLSYALFVMLLILAETLAEQFFYKKVLYIHERKETGFVNRFEGQ